MAFGGLLGKFPGVTRSLPNFSLIGYYPYWSILAPRQLPFDKLTHVIFSFINPTSSGGLVDVHFNMLTELVQEAHRHGVKVSIAIGGWTMGETKDWETMASYPASLGKFVKNVTDLCINYSLDGVDIDWEYPNAGSADIYAVMMNVLADALHKHGLMLSAAVATERVLGMHIRDEVLECVDFLNIKCYDGNPGRPELPHSSYEYAEEGLKYWLKRGCPRRKAMLGMPFYGRTPEKTYRELVAEDDSAAYKDRVGTIQYDGIPTIQKKTELAMRKAAGVMVWELSQDAPGPDSLLAAIHRKIHGR